MIEMCRFGPFNVQLMEERTGNKQRRNEILICQMNISMVHMWGPFDGDDGGGGYGDDDDDGGDDDGVVTGGEDAEA